MIFNIRTVKQQGSWVPRKEWSFGRTDKEPGDPFGTCPHWQRATHFPSCTSETQPIRESRTPLNMGQLAATTNSVTQLLKSVLRPGQLYCPAPRWLTEVTKPLVCPLPGSTNPEPCPSPNPGRRRVCLAHRDHPAQLSLTRQVVDSAFTVLCRYWTAGVALARVWRVGKIQWM